MKTFFTRLVDRVQAADTLLCIGLDPFSADLSAPTVSAARDFCMRLVDATQEVAGAYKPNSAFFEAFGVDGWALLQEVISSIPPEIPVILDAKRGDIASTAEAYVQAVFKQLGAGAVTINPYLGRDAIAPFLRDPTRAVFLLCKTSNPGAADVQDLVIQNAGNESETGSYVYEYVARLAQGWSISGFAPGNIGLVVGATQPAAMARGRRAAPDLWFLAPGIGAQGGDLSIALKAGLREDGSGILISVSRGISRAVDPHTTATRLRDQVNEERARHKGRPARRNEGVQGLTSTVAVATPVPLIPPALSDLAESLLTSGCVKFGSYTLKSGLVSPIYIDLRQLISNPALLAQAARAYLPLLQQLTFDRLAALPYAGLPIATAICLQGGWPMVYPRKEAKVYGTQVDIEGVFQPGERVVVIDDLATTGSSKFEAIAKLSNAGLQVTEVVVLIDRQSGAVQALDQAGYRLHAVFSLTQLLDHWAGSGKVPQEQIAATRQFLAET